MFGLSAVFWVGMTLALGFYAFCLVLLGDRASGRDKLWFTVVYWPLATLIVLAAVPA
jgi:hypothetical protein